MATQAREGSPLLTYEADEAEGRKAFEIGSSAAECPYPPGQGGNMRRLAWMRGYYAAKYWDRHKFKTGHES